MHLVGINIRTFLVILQLKNLLWLWLRHGKSSPTDCHLFVALKQSFSGHGFKGNCEVETVVARWLRKQDMCFLLAYLLTYLLTYSIVQSPSWEANRFAASQEIPRISRNPKVHYRTHKRPPSISILGQPYPVHIPTSHLLKIRPNIIHPSTPRSLQWSLSLRFPHQDPIHPLSSPIRATCPAHLIVFLP